MEKILEMIKTMGEDVYDYKVSEGCIEVVIDDFEGFDDDWAEITRDYENPEAVDAFEEYVAKHESEFDFEIYVDYTSSDI